MIRLGYVLFNQSMFGDCISVAIAYCCICIQTASDMFRCKGIGHDTKGNHRRRAVRQQHRIPDDGKRGRSLRYDPTRLAPPPPPLQNYVAENFTEHAAGREQRFFAYSNRLQDVVNHQCAIWLCCLDLCLVHWHGARHSTYVLITMNVVQRFFRPFHFSVGR